MPDYHAWTHRPKEEGGTDPIIFPEVTGASTPVEWIYLSSTTNWGTSLTTLSWSGAASDYDTGTPTFSLNSGNLRIGKSGVYNFNVYIINTNVSSSAWNSVRVDFARVSGPNVAAGPHGWTTSLGSPYSWQETYYAAGDPFGDANPDPFLHTFAAWPSTTSFASPFELQVQAVKYWDGTETADSGVVARMLVQRSGDTYT